MDINTYYILNNYIIILSYKIYPKLKQKIYNYFTLIMNDIK